MFIYETVKVSEAESNALLSQIMSITTFTFFLHIIGYLADPSRSNAQIGTI